MALTLDAFRDVLKAALPPGKLWRFNIGGNAWLLKDSMAECLLDVHQESERMQLEMDPRTAYEMLPEWEANYGLPDPDGPQALSIADRRAMVLARKIDIGGQSKPYLLQQIEAMGYVGATIDGYDLCTCESDCESYLFDSSWLYAFLVTLPAAPDALGATCDGSCEDYLGVPMNSHIENYINRLKPAHRVAIFAYVGG